MKRAHFIYGEGFPAPILDYHELERKYGFSFKEEDIQKSEKKVILDGWSDEDFDNFIPVAFSNSDIYKIPKEDVYGDVMKNIIRSKGIDDPSLDVLILLGFCIHCNDEELVIGAFKKSIEKFDINSKFTQSWLKFIEEECAKFMREDFFNEMIKSLEKND